MDRARPRAVRGESVSSFSDSDTSEESIDGRSTRTCQAVDTRSEPSTSSETDADRGSSSSSSNESQSDEEGDEPDPATQARYLSFGALASAQASILGKRTRDQISSHRRSRDNDSDNDIEEESHKPTTHNKPSDRKTGQKPHQRPQIPARSSKHAPTELTSKKAVSRKRPVISETSTSIPNSITTTGGGTKPRPRDPRFHSVSGPLNLAQVETNYAFLSDYRANELASLRAAVKSTTTKPNPKSSSKSSKPPLSSTKDNSDEKTQQALKTALTRLESQHLTSLSKAAKRKIYTAHRRSEREKISRGKKPYYLKASAARRAVLEERFAEATPKERERMVERRRKKIVGLERKRDLVPAGRRRG